MQRKIELYAAHIMELAVEVVFTNEWLCRAVQYAMRGDLCLYFIAGVRGLNRNMRDRIDGVVMNVIEMKVGREHALALPHHLVAQRADVIAGDIHNSAMAYLSMRRAVVGRMKPPLGFGGDRGPMPRMLYNALRTGNVMMFDYVIGRYYAQYTSVEISHILHAYPAGYDIVGFTQHAIFTMMCEFIPFPDLLDILYENRHGMIPYLANEMTCTYYRILHSIIRSTATSEYLAAVGVADNTGLLVVYSYTLHRLGYLNLYGDVREHQVSSGDWFSYGATLAGSIEIAMRTYHRAIWLDQEHADIILCAMVDRYGLDTVVDYGFEQYELDILRAVASPCDRAMMYIRVIETAVAE